MLKKFAGYYRRPLQDIKGFPVYKTPKYSPSSPFQELSLVSLSKPKALNKKSIISGICIVNK